MNKITMKIILATLLALSSPCFGAYGWYQSVTLNSGQVPSDQSTYTLLFRETHADFATVANGGKVENTVLFNGQTVPADFTLQATLGGAALSFDLTFYDGTTGTIEGHTTVTTAPAAGGIIAYAVFGDSGVTTYQGGSVGATYGSTYKGYFHFSDGTTLNVRDASSSGNNGTNTASTAGVGQVGGAIVMNGTTAQVAAGTTLLNTPTAGTVNLWMYPTASGQVNGGPAYANTTLFSKDNIYIGLQQLANDHIRYYMFDFSQTILFFDSASAVALNTWTMVTVTWDASGTVIYLNGVSDATNSLTWTNVDPGNTGTDFTIGAFNAANRYTGRLDELSFQNVKRPQSWVTSTYNDQSAPSTFLTFGTTTANPAPSTARRTRVISQ